MVLLIGKFHHPVVKFRAPAVVWCEGGSLGQTDEVEGVGLFLFVRCGSWGVMGGGHRG